MRRKFARSSSLSSLARRRLHPRGGFRPAVSRLEDRTLLSLNPTSISVTASNSQVVYGQPVTFTATVSEVAPAGATPTGGTVTFYDGSPYDGSTAIGTAPLDEGSATLTTASLYGGPSMISAIYSGDGQNFAGAGFGTVTTVAGNGTAGYSGDKGLATAAELRGASGTALDAQGDLFIADLSNNVVREVTPDGIITTVAGTGTAGYSGDGCLATGAELNRPTDVAVDAQGDLFIADSGNNAVREVTPNGIITTILPFITYPSELAVDPEGDLFVLSEYALEELKPNGVVVTGIGGCGSCSGLAVDAQGDLFIAAGNVVREVTPGGVYTTVAGDGTAGYSGDGGPATNAELSPGPLAVDGHGDLFIATSGVVREVTPGGVITTVAGNGQGYVNGQDYYNVTIPATAFPTLGGRMTVDGEGDLLATNGFAVERLVPGLAINVSTAATVTSVTANTPVYGQPWSFTATVTRKVQA